MVDCHWNPPPKNLELPRDEVHVFCAALEQPGWYVQNLLEILSPDEQLRADRFHFPHHRKRFIVGRGLLRNLLSYYLKIEPKQVEFSYGFRGKPFLANPNYQELNFNLSHSGELALYAITRGRCVGVDIEEFRQIDNFENLAKRFFSPLENVAINSILAEDRLRAFFNCWTRKEAFVKANGEGLSSSLARFDVTVSSDFPAKLLSIDGDDKAAEKWCLLELTPASGYVAALAVEGHTSSIHCWQYEGGKLT